jgi:hypothetical protein
MGFFKSKPAREQCQEHEIVTDLDALDSQPTWFRFEGKPHKIMPLTTGEMMRTYQAFHQIDELTKKNVLTVDELIDAWVNLFSSVCDTMDRETVSRMNQRQCAALFALIMDTISGRVNKESAQKKTLAMDSTLFGSTLRS